jgi:peptide/nickel transport system permease protein
VSAARSLGAGRWYVLRRHLLPQAYGVWAALCILEARHAVMAEAGLAFLGLEDPGTKSWGMMLAFAFNHQATFISDAWRWTVLPPALAITVFMLALTLSAAGLETAFNPRLRQRSAPLVRRAAAD